MLKDAKVRRPLGRFADLVCSGKTARDAAIECDCSPNSAHGTASKWLRKAKFIGLSGFVVPVLSKYHEIKNFKGMRHATASETSSGGQYKGVYCGNTGPDEAGVSNRTPEDGQLVHHRGWPPSD